MIEKIIRQSATWTNVPDQFAALASVCICMLSFSLWLIYCITWRSLKVFL
jgi:uncharacterized protein with PQ loop repeat